MHCCGIMINCEWYFDVHVCKIRAIYLNASIVTLLYPFNKEIIYVCHDCSSANEERWTFWRRIWHESTHDDVIKWKHFPRYWPFVRGIHRSPVNSPHKGQWRVWINGWVNNGEAGDLRRYRVHYDVTIMRQMFIMTSALLALCVW